MSEKKFLDNPVLDTEVELRKIIGLGGYRFYKTVILTSALADVPVSILSAENIEQIVKALGLSGAYVEGFSANVNGAVAWGTVATVKIRDTADTPNDLVTLAVAGLTANAFLNENTAANVTLEDEYERGDLIADQKGIEVVGNATGTGSDLVVRVWGRIA